MSRFKSLGVRYLKMNYRINLCTLVLKLVVDVSLICGSVSVCSCGAEIVADEPYFQLHRQMSRHQARLWFRTPILDNNQTTIPSPFTIVNYDSQEPTVVFVLAPSNLLRLHFTVSRPTTIANCVWGYYLCLAAIVLLGHHGVISSLR
jgi:hypothetical protein